MYIYDMFFTAQRKHPDNIATNCDKEAYSYKELNSFIIDLSNRLNRVGIFSGAKVGVVINNPIIFIIVLLAINYTDAVILPIYSKTGIGKIRQLVECFQINFLISDAEFPGDGESDSIFFLDKQLSICRYPFEHDSEQLEDVELILFSSGTTNMPKAIMLTKENLITNLVGISDYLKLTHKDHILLIKNLVHASSLIGELLVSFYNGCTVYLTRKIPTPSVIINLLNKYDITIFFAVPAIIYSIIDYRKKRTFTLNNLRIINFYGAKMSQRDILEVIHIFAGINIIYSYGLTEAAPRVTYIEGKDLLLRPASSGKPIKNVSVLLRNMENQVGKGCSGEIVVKGLNVMKGYYRNPDLTKDVLKDGMLFTGDLGYFDEDGYLYVTGRKDNMFIISGKNIYPEEIEETILHNKNVKEALVKGEYSRNNNILEINAYIVVDNLREFNRMDLYKYLKSNLENYKIPHHIILTEQLEKTITGKIIRENNSMKCGR